MVMYWETLCHFLSVYESRIEFESFRLYFIFKFKWFFCCYLFFSRDFSDILSVFCVGCRLYFISSYSIHSSIQFVFFGRIAIVQCFSTLDLVLHFRYKFDSDAPHTTRHFCLKINAFTESESQSISAKVSIVDGFPFGLNRHRWSYRCVLLCTKWIE